MRILTATLLAFVIGSVSSAQPARPKTHIM